ncbi:MAG: [Clostridia bacterium]|nr:[FeFe] hydrogenase H-cluster radical SAM maturase HydE [Clostridia bacterium]
MNKLIRKIIGGASPTDEEVKHLLSVDGEDAAVLHQAAREVCDSVYGKKVFIRGLIEISSYCKNDCLYCGIRRSNRCAERYRLTPDEIVECALYGYSIGFRTFVLQGGEDGYFTDAVVCRVVERIKSSCEGCAVTLSLGERSTDSYAQLRRSGADRYLLRHESADFEHYAKLHPRELTLENRIRCLGDLKSLGFQTGCGFMVGSPHQTLDSIVKDIRFIEELQPEMVGIGPFIPHRDTPFRDSPAGSVSLTLNCLAIVRLILPKVLLPATTALGSLEGGGRERGILAGANVVMPNLSPHDVRRKYSLYDNKLSTGVESVEGLSELRKAIESIGYVMSLERGDHLSVK